MSSIVDQALAYYKEKREKAAVTQPQAPAEETEKFEPSTSYSHVFSETIGQKRRPSMNINLEDPRFFVSKRTRENEKEDIRNRPFHRKKRG